MVFVEPQPKKAGQNTTSPLDHLAGKISLKNIYLFYFLRRRKKRRKKIPFPFFFFVVLCFLGCCHNHIHI